MRHRLKTILCSLHISNITNKELVHIIARFDGDTGFLTIISTTQAISTKIANVTHNLRIHLSHE